MAGIFKLEIQRKKGGTQANVPQTEATEAISEYLSVRKREAVASTLEGKTLNFRVPPLPGLGYFHFDRRAPCDTLGRNGQVAELADVEDRSRGLAAVLPGPGGAGPGFCCRCF